MPSLFQHGNLGRRAAVQLPVHRGVYEVEIFRRVNREEAKHAAHRVSGCNSRLYYRQSDSCYEIILLPGGT